MKWGGWVKAKYVCRGEEVERVTQIGTKRTRIENKGAQIGIKGTPNRHQTSTLTKITQNINLTEILWLMKMIYRFPDHLQTKKTFRILQYCKQTILSGCFV